MNFSFKKSTYFTIKSFFFKTPGYMPKTFIDFFIEFIPEITQPKNSKNSYSWHDFFNNRISWLSRASELLNRPKQNEYVPNFGISKTNLYSIHFLIKLNCMLINFLTHVFFSCNPLFGRMYCVTKILLNVCWSIFIFFPCCTFNQKGRLLGSLECWVLMPWVIFAL